MTADAVEHAAYAVRAIMAQLANHKYKQRVVPKEYRRHFESIMDKIKLPKTEEVLGEVGGGGQGGAGAVRLPGMKVRVDLDVLSVSSTEVYSRDSDTSDRDDPLESTNPMLQMLLKPRRRRLHGKQSSTTSVQCRLLRTPPLLQW